MKKITKNNYEAFLLDYFEENLSLEMVAELMLFLENNPNLKIALEDTDLLILKPEDTTYSYKNELKKSSTKINLNNYENYFIAEIEGTNKKEKSAEVQAFLKNNPTTQQVFNTYKKTKLIPPLLVFKDKELFYRKEKKVISIYWWYSSIAAIVILMFFLKVMYYQNQTVNTLAKTQPKEIIKTNKVQNQLNQNTKIYIKPKINKLKVVKSTKRIKPIGNTKKQIVKQITNKLLAKVVKKDTTKTILTPLRKRENLYTNNVKITFDDEVKQPVNIPKKLTKMAILKKLLQKPFAKIFHQQKNKDGDVVAYAFNIGKISFYKKRR